MSDAESRSIAKQIKRYAQVGGVVGKLATKLASQKYLGVKLDKEKHALGAYKDSDRFGFAPPMGWLFVKRRMASELSSDWLKNFKEFDKEATRAASLGQVHKAVLNNSEKVACKLQYPDMQSAVSADLSQLKMIFSIYQTYNKAIKTSEVYKEITDRLNEELDYEREKKLMNIFNKIFSKNKYIHVPKTYENLSTKRLLTMSWLEGKSILTFKDAKKDVRNSLARNMYYAWYKPFFEYGVIHGDPHLGNYSVQDDLSINLYDFGCMRIFQSKFIQGVIDLYFALPLMEDKVQKIQENDSGVYGAQIASEVHRELKKIGGVKPPKEFVFMDRAAVGLGSVFMHLKAEVNWYRVFHELIDNFDQKKLTEKQQNTLKSVNL